MVKCCLTLMWAKQGEIFVKNGKKLNWKWLKWEKTPILTTVWLLTKVFLTLFIQLYLIWCFWLITSKHHAFVLKLYEKRESFLWESDLYFRPHELGFWCDPDFWPLNCFKTFLVICKLCFDSLDSYY